MPRVPDRPVGQLPVWAAWVVVIADVFMVLMVSRPASGSLRNTWVTPASLWLCTSVAICGLLLALAELGSPAGGGWRALGAIVLLIVTVGSASVSAVGFLQRR